MRERAYYCLRGVYETKKYFVELGCDSSFHHAYWCSAIYCSWGQPPVPGADASIPDTAYQNYRYGEALNANASAIILARKHIYEMLDKQVEENKKKCRTGRTMEESTW